MLKAPEAVMRLRGYYFVKPHVEILEVFAVSRRFLIALDTVAGNRSGIWPTRAVHSRCRINLKSSAPLLQDSVFIFYVIGPGGVITVSSFFSFQFLYSLHPTICMKPSASGRYVL